MLSVQSPSPARRAERPDAWLLEMRAIVQDLSGPVAWIYWCDLAVTLAIAYTAAGYYLDAVEWSGLRVAALVVAAFGLFRAGSFIHEIVHFRRGQMGAFTVAWNILCGVMMLMPSFFYGNHADHHRKDHYGTAHDGEYLPMGAGPPRQILWFYAQPLLLPILSWLRFAILTPLSLAHPGLRQWTLERASSYGINFGYRRHIPANAPRKLWAATELLCCLRAWFIFVAVLLVPAVPLSRVFYLYLLAVLVIGLNYVRNLTAHRYRNEGGQMSYLAQLEDSVNIEGVPVLTELFYPLGLRYHALHHLFPSLPYHTLGTAHRRLMAELPADSPYRQTVAGGFWSVARQIIGDSWAARTRPARHVLAR